jgi:site-specific DNA recombinase
MKIGIYCRVSSDDQALNGFSLLDQEVRGVEYCIQNGYEYEVFIDGGVSGNTLLYERPSGYHLIQKTEKKKDKNTGELFSELDGIYITDWDRISRNEKDKIFIIDHLITNKIKYIELGDEKDLNDPNQHLLMSIKSILSAYEIKKLRIRIKRGLERSVAEGNVGGGSMVNYGYKKGDNKKLIIDEVEAKIVKKIFQLSMEGMGVKKISNFLNDNQVPTKRMIVGNCPMKVRGEEKTIFLWRDSVIYNMLKNPIYKGERLYKGKTYPSPNIVSIQEFNLVQELLTKRINTKDTTNKYFYLLKGLIYCDRCRSRFYGRMREDLSDNQYICSSQRYSKSYCGNRGINIPKLNNIVWSSFMTLPKDLKKISNPENNKRYKKLKMDINTNNSRIKKNTDEIKRLVSLFKPGEEGFKYIKSEIDKYVFLNSRYEKKLNLLNTELQLYSSEDFLIERLEKQIKGINDKENISEIEKQIILRNYVKQIDILWDNNIRNHIITIDFKYDINTDIYFEKIIKIQYVKSGWRFDESDLSYEFHKKIPKIENVKIRGEVVKQVKKSSLDVRMKDKQGQKNKFDN